MMQLRQYIVLSIPLVIGALLPTSQLAADDISISGKVTANGTTIKGLPVVIQNKSDSWVLSTNKNGAFSAIITSESLKDGKYEILIPNAAQTVGTFTLIPVPSPWYAPWTKDGYDVVVDKGSVGTSATISSKVEVKGFGDINSITLDLNVATK